MTVINFFVGLLHILPLLAERVHVFPPVAKVFEHENVNITCDYKNYSDGLNHKYITWFRYSGIATEEISEIVVNNKCSVLDNLYLESVVNYTVSCGQNWTTITLINVTRERHDEVWSCRVGNYGHSNNSTLFVMVPIAFVNITQPQQDKITVNEREIVTLVCETSPGRPPAVISWIATTTTNGFIDMTVNFHQTRDNLTVSQSAFSFYPARSDNKNEIFCSGSNSDGKYSKISRRVLLNVLFPPETGPKIIGHENGSLYSVAENSRGDLSCVIPTSYPNASLEWSCYDLGTLTATKDYINSTVIWTAVRDTDRKCVCNASHVMAGNQHVYVNVEILFPPSVGRIENTSVVEGLFLKVQCPYSPGNPPETKIKWTREIDETQWNERELSIINISRKDATKYTCSVTNIMQPTNAPELYGSVSGSFFLNVWYKSSISSFYVEGFENRDTVTVNEGSSVTFNCEVKSNPASDVTLKLRSQTIKRQSSRNLLQHTLLNVTCFEAGVYTCEGINQYNDGQLSKTDLKLLVQCKPRAFGFVAENITSKLHESATFNLTALVYPQPDESEIQWRKRQDYTWKPVVKDSSYVTKISQLETDGVNMTHTSLTVLNVTPQDLGIYTLYLENPFGNLTQSFYLVAEDKPQPPFFLTHPESFMTDSTITLRWKPGFNGGYPQVFFLKFKQAAEQSWCNISIEDTGDEEMNYTLSNLSTNTDYMIKMFAMNTIGRSEETAVFTLKTKHSHKRLTSNNAAVVGGSVTGVTVAVVLAIIGLVIVKRRGVSLYKKKEELAKENDDVQNYETLQEAHTYSNTATDYELLQVGTIQPCTVTYVNVIGASTDTEQQPYVNINTVVRTHEKHLHTN